MSQVKSEKGSVEKGRELDQGTMTTPQTAVCPNSEQSSTKPTAASPSASSEQNSPSTPLQDIKLIYINNKPGESDAKPSGSITLSNGVTPKVVIPSASNSSTFAYLGTLIKQGKESGEGQKVLLTPFLKEGGRFILPRSSVPAIGGRSGTGNNSPRSTGSPGTGQVYITPPQSKPRSFVIHNANLTSKDLINKGKLDSGTVVPKVLPPPKVPLVVCSSRAHDVTLTSVKPLISRDDSPLQTIDVANLRSLVSKEPTAQSDTRSVSHQNESNASSDVPATEKFHHLLKDLPPLTPINPINQTNHNQTLTEKSDSDDVEIVGNGAVPLPIIAKPSLKLLDTTVSSQASTTSCDAEPPKKAVTNTPDDSESNTTVEPNDNMCDSDKKDNTTVAETDSTLQQPKTLSKQSENVVNNDKNPNEIVEKISGITDSQILLQTITGGKTNRDTQLINDPNVVILKSKNNSTGFKVSSTNGHFVRILSSPNSSSENREVSVGSRDTSGTVFFKEGKAVVFGNLAKELRVLKEQQAKEQHAKEQLLKELHAVEQQTLELQMKEQQKKEMQSKDQQKKETQLKELQVPVKEPVEESGKAKDTSNESSNEPSKDLSVTASSKLLSKSFPIRVPPNQIVESLAKVGIAAQPKSATNVSGHVQIKELSKESAMMERSRKRKGAPLLRDCFKKTIAVKRLEPLPGAMSVEPLQVIEWDPVSSIGTLPGSDIRFVLNSYGALQVYEGDTNCNSKTIGGVDVIYCNNDGIGKDDIGRCIECECYGLLVEFIEDKFCSSSCRERNQVRQALISKRALAALSSKETNKKRKLFEIALNKSRPIDENHEVVVKDENSKPKISKLMESKVTENKHSSDSKSNPVKLESRTDSKQASPPKLAADPALLHETKATPPLKPTTVKPTFTSKTTSLSKVTKDSSVSVEVNSTPLRSILPLKAKPLCVLRPVAQKNASTSELVKHLTAEPLKTPTSEDKKPNLEKLHLNKLAQQADNSTKSSGMSTSDSADKKASEASFDWCEYLSQTRSHPAWVQMFKDAFPSHPNMFRVGYRLEAIDPQRQSLFCAVSVSKIKGYRLKLHFDGYPKVNDFWVNVDSPNIFPCGFCSSHGIDLEPPWGFKKESFSWTVYLLNIKAKPAPPKCFIHKQIDSSEPNLFKVGMKIEAVDKKNSFLVCVATVAAVVDHRILIHFDSWDDSYDYWTEYCSPNIHPVGWCQRHNYVLTPPNGHKKKIFSWKKYLTDTNSEAAPDNAFMVRPPIKFKKGSKLEAVDPRAPHLLRVATVRQILPYQVHIVFDGFPDHFGYWFDDDSPDLHPIGWGARTGHPLTPPPKPSKYLCGVRKCSTPGCFGDGNIASGDAETHSVPLDCPYSLDNLDEDNLQPDRLSQRNSKIVSTKNQSGNDMKKEVIQVQRVRKPRDSVDSVSSSALVSPTPSNESATASSTITPASTTPSSTTATVVPLSEKISSSNSNSAPNKTSNSESSSSEPVQPPSKGLPVHKPLISSESPPPLIPIKPVEKPSIVVDEVCKEAELSAACDKFLCKSLNLVTPCSEIKAGHLLDWDYRKVTSFVESIVHRATNTFYNNKVDGEGLLMLSEDDLCRKLNFSSKEASCIYSNVVMLREKFS